MVRILLVLLILAAWTSADAKSYPAKMKKYNFACSDHNGEPQIVEVVWVYNDH